MDTQRVESLISSINSKKGMNLTDLSDFIDAVAKRSIENELIVKWLKAVHSNGISGEETTRLTRGMMESGAVLEWDDNTRVVDKHSTGGVGDKMSLILAPALAACGLKVPMLAGRGLGHTGGTIDKLESIPGFNCSLNPEEMKKQVMKLGCCIAAQNDAIAPADGLLYAIRDVTNTIDSIPLITASIISKKAAEGLGSLVLDVKCGSAAFMKTRDDAEELAISMVSAAKGLGINATAQITQMDYPIGRYIGNSLEVMGSIEVLQGRGSKDTRELVVLQGSALLQQSKITKNMQSGIEMMNHVLDNGTALQYFEEMCVLQGVDKDIAKELIQSPKSILPKSKYITDISAIGSGYVSEIDSMVLAGIARSHGAGRFALEDLIVPEIGFEIIVTRGQYLNQGDNWVRVHHNDALTDQQTSSLNSTLTLKSIREKGKSRLIKNIL